MSEEQRSFELSVQGGKDFRESINRFLEDIRSNMEIQNISQLQVNFDFDVDRKDNFSSVIFKAQKTQFFRMTLK